jgi:FkbM family methyltransferase
MRISEKIKNKRALLLVIDILVKNKIKYFIEGGLFLGAVRDNDFLSHDKDFEIGMYYENVSSKILKLLNIFDKKGFKIRYVSNNKENMKINLDYKGSKKISLLPYYLDGGFRKRYSWKLPSYILDEIKKIKFLGKNINCPNYDYLDYVYGNWKKVIKSQKQKSYLDKNFIDKKFYLICKYKIRKLKLLLKKIKIKLSSKIYGRENNFNFMIKKKINENSIFIEVGSSDGFESKTALSKNKSVKSVIFEPSINNKKKIIQNLKKKKYQGRYKILNLALSDKNSKIKFYFNNKNPNLNSTIYKENLKFKNIKAVTFDFISKKLNIKTPVLIKLDIEGGEVNFLKGAMNFLLKNKNVSLLLELHPEKYKNNNIKILIKSLIKNGYKITFVESAGSVIPEVFKEKGYKPFRVRNERGLYKNLSTKFVLDNAFKKTFYFYEGGNGFGYKIIRSLLLEK